MSSGPAASKPYKVCPDIVTAKDTPCQVAKPSAAIVHRLEVRESNDVRQLEEENKILRKKIEELTNEKSAN